MMRMGLGALIAVVSAGWLVPLWLAADNYFFFWQEPGIAMLMQHQTHLDVAGEGPPLLMMQARFYFAIAILWLAIVLLGWSFVGASRLLARPRAA